MDNKIWDVIVVGGGQAGLNASYFLKGNGLEHLVLEKGRIGESWLSQRWNSFLLNSPNRINTLAGDEDGCTDPDGFWTAEEYAAYMNNYAKRFDLPVIENCRVQAVEREGDSGPFKVDCYHHDQPMELNSRQVVIASGGMSESKIPSISKDIDPSIAQFHAANYKYAGQVPKGAVLVVGSAQSGCQIAEDLANAGRSVFLSTSMVARIPRKYRGRDIHDWLIDMKFFDARKEDIQDPAMLHLKPPQLTATGGGNKTISLQSLAGKGVIILGKLKEAAGKALNFHHDAQLHIQFADGFSAKVKSLVNEFINTHSVSAPEPLFDPDDQPDPESASASDFLSINLEEQNIQSIIWATGFCPDFSFIKHPVQDLEGQPIHQEGCSEIPGLYFTGFPWLRSRKSSLIFGSKSDAEYVTERVKESAPRFFENHEKMSLF